jgi:hypothetical protein
LERLLRSARQQLSCEAVNAQWTVRLQHAHAVFTQCRRGAGCAGSAADQDRDEVQKEVMKQEDALDLLGTHLDDIQQMAEVCPCRTHDHQIETALLPWIFMIIKLKLHCCHGHSCSNPTDMGSILQEL